MEQLRSENRARLASKGLSPELYAAAQDNATRLSQGMDIARESLAYGFREQDLSKIKMQYNSFDSLSRSGKAQAIKNQNLNPILFDDPYDAVSSNLYRWTQQAPKFAAASPEERNRIASKWYDEQMAPYAHKAGIEFISKQQWMDNAWGRAMKWEPEQQYRGKFAQSVTSGWEGFARSAYRAGEFLTDTVGVPLRAAWDVFAVPSPIYGGLGWHNMALNYKNLVQKEGFIQGTLDYGAGAPGLKYLDNYQKTAGDYMSFWHDVTPNRTWQEKLGAYAVEQALSLPLYMAAGAAAERGVGAFVNAYKAWGAMGGAAEAGAAIIPKIVDPARMLIGDVGQIKGAVNLTEMLDQSNVGKYAAKLLALGVEGSMWGVATRERDDKQNAWQDALQMMVFGSLIGVAHKGVAGVAKKVGDNFLKGSLEKAMADAAEQKASFGAQGQRLATWDERLQRWRQTIGGVAAAAGFPGVHSMFTEAFDHVRMAQLRKFGDAEWEAHAKALYEKDPARHGPVLHTAKMIFDWMLQKGITMQSIQDGIAKGDYTHRDALINFLREHMQMAVDEMGQNVPDMTGTAAEEAANRHRATPEGQQQHAQNVALMRQRGMNPQQAEAAATAQETKTQADFITKAEESRTQTGAPNVATAQATGASGVEPLPSALARSKPKYSYGVGNNFDVEFADPRDLAAYVITGKGRSAAHDQFVEYYKRQYPDHTPQWLEQHGQRIRDTLKGLAKAHSGDDRTLRLTSQAKKAPIVAGPGAPAPTSIQPAQHEPLLERKGRYTYDNKGRVIGYSMSVGFNWKLAAEKLSKAKGGDASNKFWKGFAEFGDDADFVQDLMDYFNPVKSKGIWFEKQSAEDRTNFLGFLYHFRDNLPAPVQQRMTDILIHSPKMQSILKSTTITEKQLEFFSQNMANHVTMFMRSQWFKDLGERNIFKSAGPGIDVNTKWTYDLLVDMQKREMAAAHELFPGRSKAAQEARNHYQAALTIMHQDELRAFNAKLKADPSGPARLAHAMENVKELQEKAKRGTFGEKARGNLIKQHEDLMKELGGRKPGWNKPATVDAEHESWDDPYDDYDHDDRDDYGRDDYDYYPRVSSVTPKIEAQNVVSSHGGFGELRMTPEGRPELHLSNKAMKLLLDAHYGKQENIPPDRNAPLGLHLDPQHFPIFTGRLAREGWRGDVSDRIQLMDLLTQAKDKGVLDKGAVVVNTDLMKYAKDVGREEELGIDPTLREEWGHGWQYWVARRAGRRSAQDHLSHQNAVSLNSKEPLGLKQHLDNYYSWATPQQRAMEGGIKMITDKPEHYGVTPIDQAKYVMHYLDLLEREHGSDIFSELSTAIGFGKQILGEFYARGKKTP
jgi:hypothetical protein